MNQANQYRLLGKHELNRRHSLYENLARAIYYELEAHVPRSTVAEWHGLSEAEVVALAADYRKIVTKQ